MTTSTLTTTYPLRVDCGAIFQMSDGSWVEVVEVLSKNSVSVRRVRWWKRAWWTIRGWIFYDWPPTDWLFVAHQLFMIVGIIFALYMIGVFAGVFPFFV